MYVYVCVCMYVVLYVYVVERHSLSHSGKIYWCELCNILIHINIFAMQNLGIPFPSTHFAKNTVDVQQLHTHTYII